MSRVWIGVDPGRVHTGIAARCGTDLLAWRLVSRTKEEWPGHGVGSTYLREVTGAITGLMGEMEGRHDSAFIAVEGANVPGGFANGGFAKPTDLIGLSIVLGAVLLQYPAAVVVPPGSNGRGMLGSYPEELVTEGERRRGLTRPAGRSSDLSHVRSALDISIRGEEIGWPRTLAPGIGAAR